MNNYELTGLQKTICGIRHHLIKKLDTGTKFFVDDAFLYAIENHRLEGLRASLMSKFDLNQEEADNLMRIVEETGFIK